VNAIQGRLLRILLISAVFLLPLAVSAASPRIARAYTTEQILAPHYDLIALYSEAIGAINHQARRRGYQLDGDIKQLYSCMNQGVSFARSRHNENLIRRSKQNDKMRDGFGRLQAEKGKALVPHYGWLDNKSMNDRFQKERQSINAERKKVGQGTANFMIPTIGWINLKGLKQRIAAKQAEKKKVSDQAYRGEFKIFYPGLGWINRNAAKQKIKEQEAKINEIRAQITRGDYKVFLPHLGWVTRKTVLNKISELKRQIGEINKAFNQGTAKIHRPYVGWAMQNDVKKRIDQKDKAFWALKNSITKGTYKVSLPTLGNVNRKQIDQKIQQLKAQKNKVENIARAKNYKHVVKGFGMMTVNQINQRLRAGNLTKRQKYDLEQGRARINRAYQLDIYIRNLYLNQLTKYRNEMNGASTIQKHAFSNDLNHLKLIYQQEFDFERRYNLNRLKKQLKFLEQSLRLIPGKVPPPPKKPKPTLKYGLIRPARPLITQPG
jgi:anti-sigma28 factor (negative regulator of flagellin synthesis)